MKRKIITVLFAVGGIALIVFGARHDDLVTIVCGSMAVCGCREYAEIMKKLYRHENA